MSLCHGQLCPILYSHSWYHKCICAPSGATVGSWRYSQHHLSQPDPSYHTPSQPITGEEPITWCSSRCLLILSKMGFLA